jgi:hypothetical protein
MIDIVKLIRANPYANHRETQAADEIDRLREQLGLATSLIKDLRDACDRLMGDSDLIELDDSFEMAAMQGAAKFLGTGGE